MVIYNRLVLICTVWVKKMVTFYRLAYTLWGKDNGNIPVQQVSMHVTG